MAVPGELPTITIPDFFGLVWPNGLPPGVYTWAVFTTPPNAFADGNIEPTDIDALAADTFHTSP